MTDIEVTVIISSGGKFTECLQKHFTVPVISRLLSVCLRVGREGCQVGCFLCGTVWAVCNEPCYWSWRCGRNISCGRVLCERQSSRCSDSHREEGVCKRCLTSQCGKWNSEGGCELIPWSPVMNKSWLLSPGGRLCQLRASCSHTLSHTWVPHVQFNTERGDWIQKET